MSLSEIDAELIASNPWWRDADGWESADVQLRAARRSPLTWEPRPLHGYTTGGLYILRGPRRSGKSTALKQLIAGRLRSGSAPRTVLHVSVEGRSDRDLVDIVRRGAEQWLTGEPGERLWIIDEITGVDGAWPEQIKRLRDNHPSFSADTVVLTGSSSARFDEARKLLAGRRNAERSDRILFQMGFVDVASALGRELPDPPGLRVSQLGDADALESLVAEYLPWVPTLTQAWDQYLRVGGYPQAVAAELRNPGARTGDEALTDALWDVIHGDAFGGSGLTHTQTQAILRSLASALSSLLSLHGLARDTGVHHSTAESRLDALRRAFIAFPVNREQGLAPKPRSQSKWYFTDPRLARLAAEFGAGAAPDPTALSEQQLAVALLRALEEEWPGAAMRHDRLLYYRSSTGAEIDFVSASFAQTCLESKFVDRAWGRAFQTIAASGKSPGVVATRSGLNRHEGGWALPAGLIAFLLTTAREA
ncbi:MAG TPA: AAA family ATPase [Gemmatimonadaceae bacterium]|nr:AAA family ATPase [Gemmatimonadaceae bacterium]